MAGMDFGAQFYFSEKFGLKIGCNVSYFVGKKLYHEEYYIDNIPPTHENVDKDKPDPEVKYNPVGTSKISIQGLMITPSISFVYSF